MRAIFINLLILCIFSGQSQANLPDSELEQKTVVPTAAKEKNNNNKDEQSRFERSLNNTFVISAWGVFTAASLWSKFSNKVNRKQQHTINLILCGAALLNAGISGPKFIHSLYKIKNQPTSHPLEMQEKTEYHPLSLRVTINDVKTACLHTGNISMMVCGAIYYYVHDNWSLSSEKTEHFESIADNMVIVGTSAFLSHAALWSIDKLHYWWFNRTHKNVKPVLAKVK